MTCWSTLPMGNDLLCDLNSPSWTGCNLTHQVIKLNVQSSLPSLDGSGIYKIWPRQVQKVQVHYMNKWLEYHGLHSWYTAFSLPGCTYNLMIDRGSKDSGLVYRWFCLLCRCYMKVVRCSFSVQTFLRTVVKIFYTYCFSIWHRKGAQLRFSYSISLANPETRSKNMSPQFSSSAQGWCSVKSSLTWSLHCCDSYQLRPPYGLSSKVADHSQALRCAECSFNAYVPFTHPHIVTGCSFWSDSIDALTREL